MTQSSCSHMVTRGCGGATRPGMVSSLVRESKLAWKTLCTFQAAGMAKRKDDGPIGSNTSYGPRRLAASFFDGASVLRLYDSNQTLSPTANVRSWRLWS